MSSTGLHISISAEPIFHIGNLSITNSMFTGMVVSTLIIIFALIANKAIKKTDKPGPLQNFTEFVVELLYGLVSGISDDKTRAGKFFPLIASFFIFIIFNNWFGLIPGVGTIMVPVDLSGEEQSVEHTTEEHSETPELVDVTPKEALQAYGDEAINDQVDDVQADEGSIVMEDQDHSQATDETAIEEGAVEEVGAQTGAEEVITEDGAAHTVLETPLFRPATADLNTTIALGIISIVMTQVFGLYFLKINYLGKFFNFSSPIMFFVGILELISEFSKIISFAFRLFGNVFAGEVLLVVITYLSRLIIPVPFYGLEVFVGFIQALVFAMLSVVFFNMATQAHEEH